MAELRSTLTAVPQAVDPMPVVESLAAAVDAAAAGAFRTDPAVGNANLATVESTVAAVEGGVAIASAGNSYRLASSSSPLVLTVQNTLPFDVALSVRITGGERVGLSTTDPGPQLIEAGSSQQIRIPTEVSRSGQFQVGAQLVTSTGATWGSPVVLAVESTAYGAFTVIMMIVAGGVLVLMVALRIVQRLRARRARLAAQAAADQPGQTVPDEPAPIQPPPDEPTAHEPTAQVDPTPHPAAGEQPAGPSPGPQPARNATDRATRGAAGDTRSSRRGGHAMTSEAGPTTAPATPHQEPPHDAVAGMKTARTGGVVRAGAVMAVATLVSRGTGFLAKVVIVSVLGFGVVNDAYTIANTLPNIIFELLIGGVLTSVAIPLLSRARADPDGGVGYTQRLMTAAVVGLLGATALAIACAPLLTNLYLAGDSATVDQGLANALAYLLLPQIFFYGIAALFAAILNTEEKFGVPAWAPVVNNLVVIGVGIALLLMPGSAAEGSGDLASLTRDQFLVLGLGTTFGIVLQAVVMLPALRGIGFRFRWRWGGDRRLFEAGGLVLWAVAYVLVSQVGYIVTTNVASANVAGGIAIYAFASMLFQLPYGIIGVSILTAIMPRMSRHAAAGAIEDVKDDASLANRLSIVALTPVAAGIAVLASAFAIVTSLYGAVDLDESLVLGATLAALIFGLVPFAVTLVQMRVFYAMKDARTPTLINAIMVAVRVPLLIACATLEPTLIVPGTRRWPRPSPTWSARSPGRSGCAPGTGRCAPSGRWSRWSR